MKLTELIIKMMKYFIVLFLLTASTCKEKKQPISNDELSSILSNSIFKYHETKDHQYLDSAYVKLIRNKDYKNFELTTTNLQLSISLLLNMKKYDELEKLLVKTKNLDEYSRLNTLNIVKYHKLKKVNKHKANSYIEENIARITDSLNTKPKDSLIFADYFSMRMFLVGKEKAIMEVDSMQTDKVYSEDFYELLKESIKVYPDEHL